MLVFLRGQFLGQSSFDPADAPEISFRRYGLAYFCCQCGDVWARIMLLGENNEAKLFEVVPVGCEQHPVRHDVPGSLLEVYQGDGLLNYLPPEAVRREFELHLLNMKGE